MAELIIESDIAITNSGDFDIIDRDVNFIGGEELSAQEVFRIFREQFDVTSYLGGSISNMQDVANDIENDLAIIIDNNINAYGEDLIVNVVPTENVNEFKIKISSINSDENVYQENFSVEGGSFSDTNPEFIEESDILTNDSSPFFEILTVTDQISKVPLAGVPSGPIIIIDPDKINFNGTFDIDVPTIIETKSFDSTDQIIMNDKFHNNNYFFDKIIEAYNEVGDEIEYELSEDGVVDFIDHEDHITINLTLSYLDIIDQITSDNEIKKSDTIRDNPNIIYPFRKITNTKVCETNIALTAGRYVLYYQRFI